MRPDEWDAIALLIDNCWRGEFDDTMSQSYFTLLSRFDAQEVMAALHALVETGNPFVPSVPEIVAQVRKMQTPALPPWSEVWDALVTATGKCADEQAAVAYLTDNCHPTVAAFMTLEGFDRMRREPFFDPDYGALRIRELHQRWQEFADSSREKMRNGLAIEAQTRTTRGLQKMSAKGLLADGGVQSPPDETIS